MIGFFLFVAGAWLLQQQAQLPSLWWCYLFIACLLVRWLGRDAVQRARWGVDAVLWLVGGFLWAAVVAHVKLSDQLPLEWEGRDMRVEGVVAELPQSFERGVRFRFDVEQPLTPLARTPASIQLAWYRESESDPPVLRAGERWRLSVRLKRSNGAANPHGFDYELWLLERGVRASGYVRTKELYERKAELVWRPAYLIERLRESIRDRIQDTLGQETATGVLVALAIGEQRAISTEEWRLFTRTGVNHLMSISGLHITMLSGLAILVSAWLWKRSTYLTARFPARKVGLMAGLSVAVLYAAVAGFAVPAQRTVIMLGVVVLATLLSRTWSSSFVLGLALFVVTLMDPFAVMAAGFWLSFAAVALIFYVSEYRVGVPSTITRWVQAQWAVTIGLIPILLVLFHQISIVSPIANAFAIPLVSLVVVPLTLVGVLLPVDFVLTMAERAMSLCLRLLEWLDATPWAVWQQAAPPAWTAPVAVIGVLWLLAPRGFPARWMGSVALLPMFVLAVPGPKAGDLWLDVMDVGQGLAALVRTEHHALLFDAGPAYGPDSDAGDRIVLPYLRAQGITELTGVIASHDDSDHFGGMASVLETLPVGWMASSLPATHSLHGLIKQSVHCIAGQRWQWDGVAFAMLHPGKHSYERADIKDNNRSCVLQVSAKGSSILIPADAEASAEASILRENPRQVQSDVLIAPHHGSGTSSTSEFVQQVAPKIVVFTNGYRNSFGHPKEEVVQRYQRIGAKLYRSDRHGAILFRISEKGLEVKAWREERRRYWQGE